MGRKKKYNTKYSPEFKVCVIMEMRERGLSYYETVRKFELGDPEIGGPRQMVRRWERILGRRSRRNHDRTARKEKYRQAEEETVGQGNRE